MAKEQVVRKTVSVSDAHSYLSMLASLVSGIWSHHMHLQVLPIIVTWAVYLALTAYLAETVNQSLRCRFVSMKE